MNRISTLGQTQHLTYAMLKLQSELSEANVQKASGIKTDSYAGLESSASTLIALESAMARSAAYVEQSEIVAARVESMYDAVDSMYSLLGEYQELLSTAMSAENAEGAALNASAAGMLEEIVSALNIEVDGRYLFGGSVTDSAPVSLDSYTAQTTPSTESTAYYQGDDDKASVRVSDTLSVEYGVTADQSAFEKAIRTLSLGVNASENPQDTDALLEAYDLVGEAMDELLIVQAKLSADADTLEFEIDVQTDTQLRLDSMISDIEEVDLAEVVVRQEELTTQLEASYSAIASLSKLSLSDYV